MRRRLALLLAAAVVAAGVVASTAAAIAFTDDSCANDSTCRPPNGSVGASYFHKVQIRPGGGTAPYTYTISSGALPPGLSLGASSGEITGTATASGTYNFYIDGGDACPSAPQCQFSGGSFAHASAQRDFTIVVNPGLRITTNDLPKNATVGVAYSAQIEAQVVTNLNPVTGSGAAGATWTVVSGVGTGLPPGLTLANGLISGSPTTEGTYQFRIQASLNGSTHFQTYSLTVRKPLTVAATKPFATSPAPTVWEVGVPFSSKLTPAGGSGNYTFSLASGTLPTGLTVATDGTVSGTPRTAGAYRATLRLSDDEGRTSDYAANFAVAGRLVVSTLLLKPGKVGKLYRSRVVSSGGVLPKAWKITAGKLPKGVRFDRKLGVLSGTPTKAGSTRVTFQVTDGLKVVATKTLRINVLA